MAKLPDIQYRRGVMPLKAKSAAELPGKLRTIEAATGAARGAVDTIDKLVESEAKLDATRRFNDAQREYTTGMRDLMQSYHNDRDKPAGDYLGELQQMRQNIFNRASGPASGRVQKYLGPQMDAFQTRVHETELKSSEALLKSRTLMDLEDISSFEMEALQFDPTMVDVAMDQFSLAVDDAVLSEPERREMKARFNARAIATSIQSSLLSGSEGIADAVAVSDTDAYRQLDPDVRSELDAAISSAVVGELEQSNDEVANQLLRGVIEDVDEAFKLVEQNAAVLTNAQGAAREEFVHDTQADFAWRYLQGGILNGDFAQVQAELDSGKFDKYLDADNMATLLRQLATGEGGKDIYKNVRREPDREIVRTYFSDIDASPLAARPHRVNEALAAWERTYADYVANGDTIPEEFITQRKEITDAYERAGRITNLMLAPEDAAGRILKPGFYDLGQPGAATERGEALEALNNRTTGIRTDAFQFYVESGGTVNAKEIPSPTDPTFAGTVAQRMRLMPLFDQQYGADHSGVFGEYELNQMYGELQAMQGTDAFMPLLAELTTTMGADQAARFWQQIIPDSEGASAIGVAGILASQGQTDAAELMLFGEGLLKNGDVNIDDMDMVDAAIYEELGTAFGEGEGLGGEFSRTAYIRGIKSLYAAYMYAPENRPQGFGYSGDNKDLLEKAIQTATGGILTSNGRQYVAPKPGVQEETFKQWRRALGYSPLPDMYDSNGNLIPQEDLNDAFNEMNPRLELVETGRAGFYYVRDKRSSSRRGGAVPGALLLDETLKEVVLQYDPGIISNLPRFSNPRRGTNHPSARR